MMPRKWNSLSKMRGQVRPGQFAAQWAELDRMSFTRMRRFVFRCIIGGLPLRHCRIALPGIIPNRTVISQNLAFLVISMTGLALRRQHVLDPILDVDDSVLFGPVALRFAAHDAELRAKPVKRLAYQLV